MTAKAATGGKKVTAKAATQKSHYTRAQNQQFRQYLRQQSRIRKRNKHKRVARRGAPGMVLGTEWILGGNDTEATCVAVAIANSLLAATGVRVSDEDVQALHGHLSVIHGVTIEEAILAAAEHGLGGHRPVAAWRPADPARIGTIVGVTDGRHDHAATVTAEGLVSWGALLPDGWYEDGEAWSIEWSPDGHR